MKKLLLAVPLVAGAALLLLPSSHSPDRPDRAPSTADALHASPVRPAERPALPTQPTIDDVTAAVPLIEPPPTPVQIAKGGADSYYALEPAAREAYDELMRVAAREQAEADDRDLEQESP